VGIWAFMLLVLLAVAKSYVSVLVGGLESWRGLSYNQTCIVLPYLKSGQRRKSRCVAESTERAQEHTCHRSYADSREPQFMFELLSLIRS